MGSLHFLDSELACSCCGSGADLINPILLSMLEQLRSDCGGIPIKVNCAYRCPDHNAQVNGVPNSQHVLGNAADLACPPSLKLGEFKYYVDNCRDSEGHRFSGIGTYGWDPSLETKGDGFIHVDVRNDGWADDGEVARWSDLG